MFKAARYFIPSKVDELKLTPSDIEKLKAFPFLDSPEVVSGQKAELPRYTAAYEDVSSQWMSLDGGSHMRVNYLSGLNHSNWFY